MRPRFFCCCSGRRHRRLQATRFSAPFNSTPSHSLTLARSIRLSELTSRTIRATTIRCVIAFLPLSNILLIGGARSYLVDKNRQVYDDDGAARLCRKRTAKSRTPILKTLSLWSFQGFSEYLSHPKPNLFLIAFAPSTHLKHNQKKRAEFKCQS